MMRSTHDIREQKQLLERVNKEKEDILLLKKEASSKEPVQWPLRIKASSSLKVDKKRRKKFIARPLDHYSFHPTSDKTSTVVRADSGDKVNEFIEQLLPQQLKPTPTEPMDESTIDFIQDKSLDLLDQLLLKMISPQIISNKSATLDWEYILGNALRDCNIPPSVLDRVKRKMESITGKDTPAITAMNVTQTVLSDLTITTIEEEMKREIDNIVAKNDKFESLAGDEAFESPVRFLLDLDKKNLSLQTEEIQKIHLDYTNKVLDLKPAFF